MKATATATALHPVSNDAAEQIAYGEPYKVRVTIKGMAPILFHRWSCEAVDAKSKAAKGSKAKKTDDIESYTYRCDDGTLGVPGAGLHGAICGQNGAAKYVQDPRSPRKSALDLFRASVVVVTECASLGVEDWDYIDQRRVVIQRNAVTRMRPAMREGWACTFEVQVSQPEYISEALLHDVITNAGKFVGLCDYRPTYGRFQIVKFERV